MSYQKTPVLQRLDRLWRLSSMILRESRKLAQAEPLDPETRNAVLSHICREALDILNVKLDIRPSEPATATGSRLVVANHVSWLDIFAVCALCPSSFIAMQEMKKWPILGRIAANAGTVFIDRKNRKNIEPINNAIADSLKNGQNVCFFPEAGTSPGTDIRPFKAALFESALLAKAPVQPVSLRYYDAAGRRSTLFSFANVNLITSVWRVLAMPESRIAVDFAPPVLPEQAAGFDRFALKDIAENYIGDKVREDSPAKPV